MMEEAKAPQIGVSHAGRILVARPGLETHDFQQAVTLVLEHSSKGALGVIINRPSLTYLTEQFPEWEEMGTDPGVVFAGGPVDHDALIALGRSINDTGSLVLGAYPIDLDDQPMLVAADGVESVRVFSGYAGWEPGRLEYEIAQDLWWVVDATIDDLFTREPQELWTTVLKRQKGEARLYAHYPTDVSLN